MDRFDLNWPRTDATFFTDGWRCRIVWRQKGGMGGTIDNNAQCVQRVAQSLDGAPYLLAALKARGHDRLAGEIEAAADTERSPDTRRGPLKAPRTSVKPITDAKSEAASPSNPEPSERPAASAAAASEPDRLAQWVETLEGSDGFEAAENRRARVWVELGPFADQTLLLKAPAAKGKPEWVLKRIWPDSDRKAEYVAAPAFRGVARWLLEQGADGAFLEGVLTACRELSHPELEPAASKWRALAGATH
jgi:hypothetical protein